MAAASDKGGPASPKPATSLRPAGFAAVAIDAPGHGDRADRNDQVREEMRWRMTAHEPVGDVLAKYHREVIPRTVADP